MIHLIVLISTFFFPPKRSYLTVSDEHHQNIECSTQKRKQNEKNIHGKQYMLCGMAAVIRSNRQKKKKKQKIVLAENLHELILCIVKCFMSACECKDIMLQIEEISNNPATTKHTFICGMCAVCVCRFTPFRD